MRPVEAIVDGIMVFAGCGGAGMVALGIAAWRANRRRLASPRMLAPLSSESGEWMSRAA